MTNAPSKHSVPSPRGKHSGPVAPLPTHHRRDAIVVSIAVLALVAVLGVPTYKGIRYAGNVTATAPSKVAAITPVKATTKFVTCPAAPRFKAEYVLTYSATRITVNGKRVKGDKGQDWIASYKPLVAHGVYRWTLTPYSTLYRGGAYVFYTNSTGCHMQQLVGTESKTTYTVAGRKVHGTDLDFRLPRKSRFVKFGAAVTSLNPDSAN